MNTVEAFLHQWAEGYGLDLTRIGWKTIRSTLKRRTDAAGCPVADYPAFLQVREDEAQRLLDGLLVTETWFFREHRAFALLASCAQRLRQDLPGLAFRALSLGCATGEEVWSIAMTLRQAGFPASQLEIEAYDLNARAVVAARLGIYRPRSAHADALRAHQAYFKDIAGGQIEISRELRQNVSIRQANLMDAPWTCPSAGYHAIFFRNVLIYMTASARQRLLGQMAECLAPGGLLFLGHADLAASAPADLVRDDVTAAFAWRKPAPLLAAPAAQRAGDASPSVRRPSAGRPAPAPPTIAARSERVGRDPADRALTLSEVRRLADQGHHLDAERACLALLRGQPDVADAWSLLGILALAQGKTGPALRYFLQALQLEPEHGESHRYRKLLSDSGLRDSLRETRETPERRSRK